MARDLYSVRVDPALIARVDAKADLEGRTPSDVLRRLIAESLEARESPAK